MKASRARIDIRFLEVTEDGEARRCWRATVEGDYFLSSPGFYLPPLHTEAAPRHDTTF